MPGAQDIRLDLNAGDRVRVPSLSGAGRPGTIVSKFGFFGAPWLCKVKLDTPRLGRNAIWVGEKTVTPLPPPTLDWLRPGTRVSIHGVGLRGWPAVLVRPSRLWWN